MPEASRPHIPGYGVPKSKKGLLPWTWAEEQLGPAKAYWVSTSGPDGEPHAMPVWGVYVRGTLYFGGGETVWARNLKKNPRVVVHLESAADVVIVEGTVTRLTEENGDPELLEEVDLAYLAKYDMRHGTPVWEVAPRKAFGWALAGYPTSTTRWTFPTD